MGKRGRKAQEKIVDMPLDMIDPPAYEMRTAMSEEKMLTLQKSIKLLGLLQPIVVKLGDAGKYEVIAGYRRFIAHQRNKAASILVRVLDTDNVKNELAKMHENIEREDVSVMDEARFIGRMNKDMKMSQIDIARSLCRSESYVSQKVAILDAPAIIQEALEDGVIGFSVARELAKVTDERELSRLVEYAVRNGVTPAVARAWRMQWEASETINPSSGEDAQTSIPLGGETPSSEFVCDSCEKRTNVNTMKVLRVCPDCFKVVKEV